MTDNRLAAALAAERAIVCHGTPDSHEITDGWVIRDDSRPDLWHVNRVLLTGGAGALSPTSVAAITDRWLGDRPHRRITLDDAVAAEALWPVLAERGWVRERAVVMVLEGDPPPAAPPDGVTAGEISEAQLQSFQPRAFAQDAGITALAGALPARIAAMHTTLRAGTPARGFGAGLDGGAEPGSAVTLYRVEGVGGRSVAYLDQLATLRPARERGLGGAVMRAAIAAARGEGAELIALQADADDWPQLMHARLGFTTLGRQVTFHREAPWDAA